MRSKIDYLKAVSLRKKGLSYNEISRILSISKGTLSLWFSDKKWSQNISIELSQKSRQISKEKIQFLIRANKARFAKKRKCYREDGACEYKELKNIPLFGAGLMLYLGEGDSKIENSMVRLSNVTPEIIRLFAKFLIEICGVPQDRIRVSMILYPDLAESECKAFWVQQLGLPVENFHKTQYIIGRHKKNKLSYGVCNLCVCSRELKEKVFVWTKLYCKDLESSQKTSIDNKKEIAGMV